MNLYKEEHPNIVRTSEEMNDITHINSYNPSRDNETLFVFTITGVLDNYEYITVEFISGSMIEWLGDNHGYLRNTKGKEAIQELVNEMNRPLDILREVGMYGNGIPILAKVGTMYPLSIRDTI